MCRAPISIQYPLVEGATALLFIAVGGLAFAPISIGWLVIFDFLVIISILVAIFVYDLYHTIIPDPWVYAFIALAFLSQLLVPHPAPFSWTLFLFSGPIAAVPLFSLWFLSRGAAMGFGDVKLSVGIGYLLGALAGIIAIFLAFVIGALVSVAILLPLPHLVRAGKKLGITSLSEKSERFTMRSEIPFGPFLIVSIFIIWFSMLYGIELPSPLGDLLWLNSSW